MRAIACLLCGMTSYSPSDIEQRYCGNCHRWLEGGEGTVLRSGVDVRQATHVMVDQQVEKIASTWGIDAEGHLAKPSLGGFGVVTASGRHVTMWDADAYLTED